MNPPIHVTIRAELAQVILNYLATQPYAQVHQMIGELQQAQPSESAEKPIINGKSSDDMKPAA